MPERIYMSRLVPLFSSSKGNSIFVGSTCAGILVDAGQSCRAITKALDCCGIALGAVKGIFVTHEHIDHVKGLYQLQKQHKLPVYGSKGTIEFLISNNLLYSDEQVYEVNGNSECVADMEINAFCTPHDSQESVGFTITTSDERKISVCTDLGEITQEVAESLQGSDLVLLEANYDEIMLQNNHTYPAFTKKRIASNHGHLSNSESAAYIKKLICSGTTRIVLGHLSQNNNRPDLAVTKVLSELSEFKLGVDFTLDVAPVATQGKSIAL